MEDKILHVYFVYIYFFMTNYFTLSAAFFRLQAFTIIYTSLNSAMPFQKKYKCIRFMGHNVPLRVHYSILLLQEEKLKQNLSHFNYSG
jgi:hypothetical protein